MSKNAKRYKWLLENSIVGIEENNSSWTLRFAKMAFPPDNIFQISSWIDARIKEEKSGKPFDSMRQKVINDIRKSKYWIDA